MAKISTDNGLTTCDVADLSDYEVYEITQGELAVALDEDIVSMLDGSTDDPRDWLVSYCELHEATYGTALVIG